MICVLRRDHQFHLPAAPLHVRFGLQSNGIIFVFPIITYRAGLVVGENLYF
jgi:hypothetical protein